MAPSNGRPSPEPSAAVDVNPEAAEPASVPKSAKEPAPASISASWKAQWPLALALATGILFFCLPSTQSGIWDPFELNVADLSRRIGVNVFGGRSLVLEGSENSMPTLGDLGRGELPFDTIAAGFRLFGLHDWAGRLPLALWGLFGIAAVYWLLARLIDKRAGLYAAVVLCTMPLYFVQARTMLGDIVTMSAISMAFAGLGIATFDRSGSASGRVAAAALGLAGVVAGFFARGLLIGVAIPALGVGLSWAVLIGSLPRPKLERFGETVGAASLAVGAAAAWAGTAILFRAPTATYSIWMGAQLVPQPKFPTFDLVIHYLGHSLFPWSAFIPLAAGRLFRAPPIDETASDESEVRASAARLLPLLGSAVAFGVYAITASKVGYLAYGAPALLAAIVAISIRDFERGAPSSTAIGVGVAVLTALFLRDYNMFPEKGLSAFAVNLATFPEGLKDRAGTLVLASSAIFCLVVFFAWLEEGNLPSFKLDAYLAWPRALLNVWGGTFAVALIAIEAAGILAAAVLYVALYVVHAKAALRLGLPTRLATLNAFWVTPALVFVPVWGLMMVRDGFRWFFGKTGVSRGAATLTAGVVAGGLLSFVYYPALAAQLSPKEVFEAYQNLHARGESLGLLGVGGKSAAYYSGGDVKILADPASAFNWLVASPDRRWLGLRREDLGKVNSLYRAQPGPKQNAPVLDARSSQILLVSNRLLPGERNQNPFETLVFDKEPDIGHRVEANLQDVLLSLGWDITDSSGTRVDRLVRTRKYHIRLYYKVTGAVTSEWETFVHLDGDRKRLNADHKTLLGKYPLSLWQTGDYVVDDYEFSLEPDMSPGSYMVRYGLYVGDSRLNVKSGRHEDNRIEGGLITIE